ncbi:hypothetical protein M8J75_011247 [Diaphorina citri]|nr:hypothetical protein M8J75_011247 [Diaphorina citri]KAI5738276.1 hypothetical protein M8J77_004897 [Diaphorina citri]
MDVDNDNTVDQSLLLQFNCMGTTDRDDLVKQLLKLAGEHVNPSTAAFFLEMNNWNLQAAVCSYFDYESSQNNRLPSMCIDKDELSLEEMTWPPNFRFTKVWTLRNNGIETWPTGCALKFNGGDLMANTRCVDVKSIAPNTCCQCAVEFVTPSLPGTYKCAWRLITPYGAFFGDVLWVIINVTEDEESRALAEQLSRSLQPLGTHPDSAQPSNPFLSTPAQQFGSAQPPAPQNSPCTGPNSGDDEDMCL